MNALRVFIVLASITAVAMMVVINHPQRQTLSFGHVMTRAGTGVLLVAIAYGTAESAMLHVAVGPRLFVISAGLIWLNVGLIATIREQRVKRKAGERRRRLFHHDSKGKPDG